MNMTSDEKLMEVYLDANALHYAWRYLERAKSKEDGLPLSIIYGSWELAQRKLKSLDTPDSQIDGYHKGFLTLSFLHTNAGSVHVCSSFLSHAEIYHGILEGRAYHNMIRSGLLARMRQRAYEESVSISRFLAECDFTQARQDLGSNLEAINQELGITIIPIERSGGIYPTRIPELATLLMSYVYLDVLDSWHLANALTEQVEFIISFDSYFVRTLNCLRSFDAEEDPERGASYKTARTSIVRAVSELLLIDAADVRLPIPLDAKQLDTKIKK